MVAHHLIHQMESRFLQYLDNIAVEEGHHKYTYKQLRQCVHALALQIHALQGKSHQPIAVVGEPSYATVVCVLGTIFSGAIYVPIDPSWPLLRIQQLLKDAGVRLVVGLQPLKGLTDIDHFISVGPNSRDESHQVTVTFFPLKEHLDQPIEEAFFLPKKDPSDLLYMMYTSGSMGHPKAVQVSSQSFEHFLCWVESQFAICVADRFAFTSSLGFGAALRQIFSPLFSGATIVCFQQMILKQPSELLRGLHEKKITVFNVPPIVIEQIIHLISDKKYNLDHVRWVFVGGDLFPSQTAKKWFEHFKVKIVNLYGSTESIINASFYEVSSSFDEHHFLPIGKPRPDFLFHLQDEQGHFIQKNHQSGLLLIESPFLARGYHNSKETQKAFYEKEGAYFYRTGDRAMRLPSGDYLVLGRSDRQIQVYGQRIELDEIESTLNQHPDVKRSGVVSIQNNTKICAYVQSDQTDMYIFREFLKERLPTFMIPNYIDRVEQIDIYPSQKVDYQKLQTQAIQKYSQVEKIDQIQDSQDRVRQIKSIWIKHLGTSQEIGLEDSFFDKGGDSIMAVDIYHDICQAFHIEKLDPFVFYTSPTIKKLSLEVEKAQKAMSSSVPIQQTSSLGVKELFSPSLMVLRILRRINQVRSLFHWKKGVKKGPISPQQRSFITVKQLMGVNCNGYFSVPIKGDIDIQSLKENLQKIVMSQESLRTYFIGDQQIVLPVVTADVLFYDLSSQTMKDQDKQIMDIHETLFYEKAHFSQAPLFKVVLFKKSHQDFILTLCINHILADGQSLHIFLSQLNQAYAQNKLQFIPSHIDYTVAYKKHCRKNYEVNKCFWKQKLVSLKDYNTNLQIEKQVELSRDEVLDIDQEKINFLGQKYQTTSFYIFMALWTQAFAEVTSMKKIYFFATYHNRSFPFKGLPCLIAPIARMAPLLLDLRSYNNFENVLQKTKEAYLEVLNYIDFNVFKYFYSYGKSYLVGFNYIDFNPLSRFTHHFPFQWDLDQAELRLLEGDIKYTYIFLSIHSYSHLAKLRVYGRCPQQDKKLILLSIKNRIKQL